MTVAAFCVALFGMNFVQQQFFPSSDRSELVIDWNLPQNASIADTNAQMARFEREQLQGNDSVDHWSTYVGTGAPRFVLSFDVQTANTWFGQMVVVTKGGIKARDQRQGAVRGLSEEDVPRDRHLRQVARGRPARWGVPCNTA